MKTIIIALSFFLLTHHIFIHSSDSNENSLIRINQLISEFPKKLNDLPTINAKNIFKSQDSYVLVDVREEKERAISIIKNSINLDEFKNNSLKYKDKKIVFYCTIGYRSAIKTQNYLKKGFMCSNLKGGVLLWSHAKGSFVDSHSKPTYKVHVYGKKWNLLAQGYTASF